MDGGHVEDPQDLGAVQHALEALRGQLVGEVDECAGRGGEREPVDCVMSSGASVVRWTRIALVEWL